MSMSELARTIEFWRERRGLSQAALSLKAGLAASGINDIIKSPDRSPRLATVEAIAEALGISLHTLLSGGTDDAPRYSPQGGIDLIERARLTPEESAWFAATCAGLGLNPETTAIGEVRGLDYLGIGFAPGNVVLIARGESHDGRVVAVRDEIGPIRLAYCAPPWLIGFRRAGEVFHEYLERPGLEILGTARIARIAIGLDR